MTARRVIVTRPLEHTDRLATKLRTLGLDPVAVPTISFEPPATYTLLDDAIHRLDRYQWVVFTSRTGVGTFFERIVATGRSLPGHLRWAAVGPGTADALHARGVDHVWIPSVYLSSALGDELPAHRGERVLRIRAQAASPLLAERLRWRGVDIDERVSYRTVEGCPESLPLLKEAFAGGADTVVLTSASTARGFAHLLRDAAMEEKVPELTFIAIGPVTADAIRALGWPVHLVADEHSLKGIETVIRRRQIDAAGVARD